MNKNDIVVEHICIHYRNGEVHLKCNEIPDCARILRLLVVGVQFEDVCLVILKSNIDDCDQCEVQHGEEAVPGDDFAEVDGEAEDVLV